MFEFLAISAAILSVIAAFLNILFTRRQKRKVQKAFSRVLQAYSSIMEQPAALSKIASNPNKLSAELVGILDNSVETIRLLTSKPIFASIKLISIPERGDVPVVRTFARDSRSMIKREVLSLEYPLDKNIAFSKLISNLHDKAYYMVNSLKSMEEGGYYNTSFTKWPLPYLSTLVVPIRIKEKDAFRLLGFICFDSTKEGVFNEEIANIAVSISNTIASWLRFSMVNDDSDYRSKQSKAQHDASADS